MGILCIGLIQALVHIVGNKSDLFFLFIVFISEFAAEIEAARLKISYKSKTTVLRDGWSAQCEGLSTGAGVTEHSELVCCVDTLTLTDVKAKLLLVRLQSNPHL